MKGRSVVVVLLSLFAARVGAQSLPPPDDSQPPPMEYPVQQPVTSPTLGDFQQALDPYGDWVQTPDYGLVWVPSDMPQAWRPYTDGRWAYTDQGWTFVSNASWGWAPFHYGRWVVVQPYGWAWIPGYDWAPAWVTWRYGGGYIAWAPLGPLTVDVDYYSEPTMWNAVLAPDFLDPLAPWVFIPPVQLNFVLGRTYFAGVPRRGAYISPSPRRVAQLAGRPVTRVPIASVVPRNPWSGRHPGQPARPPPAATPRPYGGSGAPRPVPARPHEVTPAPSHPAAPSQARPARPVAPSPVTPRESHPERSVVPPPPMAPRESHPAPPMEPREPHPERSVVAPPPVTPRESHPERSVVPPPPMAPRESHPERSVAPPPMAPIEPAPVMPEAPQPMRPSAPPPAPHLEPMHPEHIPAPSPHPHR